MLLTKCLLFVDVNNDTNNRNDIRGNNNDVYIGQNIWNNFGKIII